MAAVCIDNIVYDTTTARCVTSRSGKIGSFAYHCSTAMNPNSEANAVIAHNMEKG